MAMGGHISRRTDDRWRRRVLESRPRTNTRSVERLKVTWADDVSDVDESIWMQIAQDWKQGHAKQNIQNWMILVWKGRTEIKTFIILKLVILKDSILKLVMLNIWVSTYLLDFHDLHVWSNNEYICKQLTFDIVFFVNQRRRDQIKSSKCIKHTTGIVFLAINIDQTKSNKCVRNMLWWILYYLSINIEWSDKI